VFLCLGCSGEVVEVEESNQHIFSDRCIWIRIVHSSSEVIDPGFKKPLKVFIKIIEVIFLPIDVDRKLIVSKLLDSHQSLFSINNKVYNIVPFNPVHIIVMLDKNDGINGLLLDNRQNELLLLTVFPHIRSLEIYTILGEIDFKVIFVVSAPIRIGIDKGIKQSEVKTNPLVEMYVGRNAVKTTGFLYFINSKHISFVFSLQR